MLQITHDITNSSGTFGGGCSDSNYLYTVTNTPDYRVYNWSAGLVNTALALSATPTGIALASAASAVIVYSGNRISIVDSLNNKLDITTNALLTFGAWGQQVAGAPSLKLAMSTANSAGKVCKTDLNAQTVTQLSPTPLSGTEASSVIYKPDTGTWLWGTITGKVFETDSSGTQQNSTLNLPNIPNVSAATIAVTGLSYYNGYVTCVTNTGNLYNYTWPGLVLNYVIPIGSNNVGATSGPMPTLTDSASGVCLVLTGGNQALSSVVGVAELWANAVSGGIGTWQTYYNESLSGPLCGGIQPTVANTDFSKAWVIFPNNTGQGLQLRLYNISSPKICSEPTRFQNPLGTDVASRCIRIRDEGIGRTSVEIDQNVSSGSQPVNCTSGRNYIEINIQSGKWDVREFST